MNYVNLGEERPLNRVIIQKGMVKQLVYYWFDERGRTVANEYWAKFYRLADSIVKNRTDGALMRLTTQIRPDETEARRRPTPADPSCKLRYRAWRSSCRPSGALPVKSTISCDLRIHIEM